MLRSALAALWVAKLCVTQSIDFAEVNAAPKPTLLGPPATLVSQTPTYKPSVAASSAAATASSDPIAASSKKRSVQQRDLGKIAKVARDACASQPSGSGPPTTPDTADAFVNNSNYTTIQSNAPVPQGYQVVFQNLQGATQQSGYLGFYTLHSYDTVQCQQYCDAAASCTAFNLYMERDPSVTPGDSCSNPPSTVNYKCSLYGLPISNATATNTGQWQDQFQVVIAASNGYVKNAAPPSYANFTGPYELGGAINAPNSKCGSTYMGVYFFPGPFDPSQCSAACQATTAYDEQHIVDSTGGYDACNFFVAYVLSKNNVPLGTYCSFYTRGWGKSYAVNTGQYDGDGNYYSVSSAYSYLLAPQDQGYIM